MSVSRFIFLKIAKALSSKNLYLTKSLAYRQKPQILSLSIDYVRYATLELCYEEIISNNVKGNVAELGVYRGDFSKRLNQLFVHKKLYLFDTFTGFSDEDVAVEHKKGYPSGDQNFADTSVDLVRSKMLHPEDCIFRPGRFPQTADGIEDRFCFVSIDVDLYEPIYQGLRYFYPRLEKGGYIFIHDVNNTGYIGARKALFQYCQENDISFVPLPDSGGTAIITK